MSDTQNKFYLTTPIYYVNARPHIGHAYTTIAADVIARRHRLLGDDTYFLTGTDEHGQKIERSAAAAGIPPQHFADQVSASFENLWKRMGITNNDFIRTTDDRHKRGVQKLFTTLQANGFIELRSYTGQYCISDETFVDVPVGAPCPECGRITETVTEQNYFFKLSAFQRPLLDLIESNTLAIQPESRRNEVLSFLRGNISSAQPAPQSAGAPSLPESHPGKGGNEEPSPATPGPTTELSAAGTPYAPGALKDLSISRTSFKWGIPVPGDETHVIYVWLDALANYMTALGYGSEDPADIARFNQYWPADLHLVGKEIIRFHCVYWPAFLLALNPGLSGKSPTDVPFEFHRAWADKMLPKAITAHGWLLFQDSSNQASKMSKSKGNIVRTETILDAFGTLKPKPEDLPGAVLSDEYWKHEQDLFASDVLRYFLLREIPFGQDGSFSFDALVQRYNSDLANGYGNLVSRTLKLVEQNFSNGFELPQKPYLLADKHAYWGDNQPTADEATSGTRFIEEEVMLATKSHSDFLESYKFQIPLSMLQLRISHIDKYMSFHKPWLLAKDPDELSRKKLTEVLYTAAESIRIITALLYPFMPYATAKVWAQLGLGAIEESARKGELKNLQWGGLQPGSKLGPLAPIFPRAPKELIQIMNDMEQTTAPQKPEHTVDLPHVNSDHDASRNKPSEFREAPISSLSSTAALNRIAESTHAASAHHPQPIPVPATPAAPDSSTIAIDDFVKIDLRVAQIILAERIPKADKLLRLEVDLGYEKRQILSGIAEWYTPEELIGRRIVVIANLAPRKMRGLESHGMLLAASHGDNGKPVLATFGEDIELGSRLR